MEFYLLAPVMAVDRLAAQVGSISKGQNHCAEALGEMHTWWVASIHLLWQVIVTSIHG
jgi:hypothetical protein